ncbi:hypothetical protein BYT27DRAFT_7183999 [Phlegmacium glaucopus]|nr:hypothetical protein BYT27DRAFT_7183999 [Phlegmacium glaucopus]
MIRKSLGVGRRWSRTGNKGEYWKGVWTTGNNSVGVGPESRMTECNIYIISECRNDKRYHIGTLMENSEPPCSNFKRWEEKTQHMSFRMLPLYKPPVMYGGVSKSQILWVFVFPRSFYCLSLPLSIVDIDVPLWLLQLQTVQMILTVDSRIKIDLSFVEL